MQSLFRKLSNLLSINKQQINCLPADNSQNCPAFFCHLGHSLFKSLFVKSQGAVNLMNDITRAQACPLGR